MHHHYGENPFNSVSDDRARLRELLPPPLGRTHAPRPRMLDLETRLALAPGLLVDVTQTNACNVLASRARGRLPGGCPPPMPRNGPQGSERDRGDAVQTEAHPAACRPAQPGCRALPRPQAQEQEGGARRGSLHSRVLAPANWITVIMTRSV